MIYLDLTGFAMARQSSLLIPMSFNQFCNGGVATQSLLELVELPQRSLVLSFSKETSRHTFEIATHGVGRKCIFCALHVFEASVQHAEYAIRAIVESNFSSSLAQQEKLLAKLDDANVIVVSGGINTGQALIHSEAVPYAMIRDDAEGDYIHSVAEFFEVHYAHMQAEGPCPFSFTGRLQVAGMLSVIRNEGWALRSELKGELEGLARSVAECGAILKVMDNAIVSFLVAGEECSELLAVAAGKRGLQLTEFAIGVNQSITRFIDYKLNSQLNEGVEGIHVAIGDGASGYHIDLLVPGVELAFSSKCQH